MSAMEWLGWIIIGTISGWLASITLRVNQRRTVWTDILIGITGAVVGGLLFYPTLAGAIPHIWSLYAASTGAVVLLAIFKLLYFVISKRATRTPS